MSTLVWFRQDLRLTDNPALYEAAKLGPIVPLYIWVPEEEREWALGEAGRWWLSCSLYSLRASLEGMKGDLIFRHGPSLTVLLKILQESGATRVFWNRRYEPAAQKRDKDVENALRKKGIAFQTFNASLLAEPGEITTKEGKPFQVFTPFWNALQKQVDFKREHPLPPLTFPKHLPFSGRIEKLCAQSVSFENYWQPGEKYALEKMQRFMRQGMACYETMRDRPDKEGVSRLSPHLHFGEISPRQIGVFAKGKEGENTYLRQIAWREFAYHLLYHFPHTPLQPLRPEFSRFPWDEKEEILNAWKQGKTGYPIIDAGMRELLITGWMHNRVRMIVGSFLTKDLLIPWQEGAKWFWETLVDADLANNTLGWQWVSGCGADAAPYFRIFNPVLQAKKFDPDGEYVRHWIPELKGLSNRWIHAPWEAPQKELENAGVHLGVTYPVPLVDHKKAREKALKAFNTIKKT